MSDANGPQAANSKVPPVYTYFGQFIDHDLTANTDRETDFSSVANDDISPAPRNEVVAKVANLRRGAFDLDSLYGGLPEMDAVSENFAAMLRHPTQKAKMWIGEVEPTEIGGVPLPADPARDLLRLERVLRSPHQQITEDEVRSLPAEMRSAFINPDGSLRKSRAIIGDGRNDENLAVAQFHLAMLRFHNKVVDHIGDVGGHDANYEQAKRIVRWTYQRLIIEDYLPRICGADVTKDVAEQGAPLYTSFANRMGGAAPFSPMPLEFSVAAFRFGHTMVRADYDWSRHFGRSAGGITPQIDRASFELLFAFTGGAANPMLGASDRLPSHWPIEWDRFTDESDAHADRGARALDAHLVPPLFDMVNESATPGHVMRHLARRNLRRGYRLNVPSAQDAIAGIFAETGVSIPGLSIDALTSGDTGSAVDAGGFISSTPLWFYVLKEAETTANGEHLGPLGARLIAETLIGVIQRDSGSYWNAQGTAPGSWRPEDMGLPKIDAVADLLRFAGVL